MYRTKLTNVASKCGKKAKAKMLEAILEHNVHVWVPNVHIWGPNVHFWLLKNSGYNLIFSFFTKIGLDSNFWHLLYFFHILSHLTLCENKIAKLSVWQCIAICTLNDIESKVLWDMGAQVSTLSRKFMEEFFNKVAIKTLPNWLMANYTWQLLV